MYLRRLIRLYHFLRRLLGSSLALHPLIRNMIFDTLDNRHALPAIKISTRRGIRGGNIYFWPKLSRRHLGETLAREL